MPHLPFYRFFKIFLLLYCFLLILIFSIYQSIECTVCPSLNQALRVTWSDETMTLRYPSVLTFAFDKPPLRKSFLRRPMDVLRHVPPGTYSHGDFLLLQVEMEADLGLQSTWNWLWAESPSWTGNWKLTDREIVHRLLRDLEAAARMAQS